MPKYSRDELAEIMRKDIAQAKGTLGTIEEALRTLKHPQNIILWEGYKQGITEYIEKLEKSLRK